MKIPIRRQLRQLLMMIPVRDVKHCCKTLTKNKIDYSLDKIEAHALAGCDLKELAGAIDKIARAKINFELWDIMMLQLADKIWMKSLKYILTITITLTLILNLFFMDSDIQINH